jgi:hypothetical protein
LFPEITWKRLSNVIGCTYSKKDLEEGMKWNVIGIYLPIRKMDDGRNAKKKQEDTSAYFSSRI